MATFQYKALARSGEVLTGEIDADTAREAIARLQAQGHIAISATPPKAAPRWTQARWRLLDEGPSAREIALLTRELGALVAAGLTVDRALAVLVQVSKAPRLRAILSDALKRVRAGASLADALGAHASVFPHFFANTVRAAEKGGFLGPALLRLAAFLAKAQALRDSVRSALIYPTILLATAGASILLIVMVVLPQFEPLFADARVAPPLQIRVLLALGAILKAHYAPLLLASVLIGVFARRAVKTERVRARLDAVVLRVPIIGDLVKGLEAARFTRNLAMLIENGVALPAALSLAGGVVSNRIVRSIVADAAARVREGRRLADCLAAQGVFAASVTEMIRVGEETGQLAPMLGHAADLLESGFQQTLERLMALLVPVITIMLGLVVAGLVASIVTVLMSVNDLAA